MVQIILTEYYIINSDTFQDMYEFLWQQAPKDAEAQNLYDHYLRKSDALNKNHSKSLTHLSYISRSLITTDSLIKIENNFYFTGSMPTVHFQHFLLC